MTEEAITNTVANETPQVNVSAEENTVANQEPQGNVQQNEQQPTVENSNQEGNVEGNVQKEDGGNQTEPPKQQSVEELQAKLKEYELREEEDKMLREQLGIGNVDQQTFNYMNIDQQIVNEGKQVYLRLCNEYGIDANPSKIDASVEALKQSDPAKAYEFQRKFEQLGNEVEYKRQMVQQQNNVYEVNKFEQDYNQLLNASPALTNIMSQYIQTYGNAGGNIYGQLKSVMDIILPAYQEAFNAGKQYALQDKARKDTSSVQGGIATANTQTYSPNMVFTREQIAKMSPDEFAKYEKDIQRQMIEGKIQ